MSILTGVNVSKSFGAFDVFTDQIEVSGGGLIINGNLASLSEGKTQVTLEYEEAAPGDDQRRARAALVLLFGCAQAFDNPTRLAFVSEMVSEDELPNAVGLNSTMFQLARIIGPTIAGVLIVVIGTGPGGAVTTH